MERLLLLLERYITLAEVRSSGTCAEVYRHRLTSSSVVCVPHLLPLQENYHFPRYYPPHGACFLGHPITLSISPDQPKTDFKLEVGVADLCTLTITFYVAFLTPLFPVSC